MKVAIVHYWLVNMRGGEKVVELLCDLFPQADIFTLVYDPSAISEKINRHKITPSFIQKLPLGVKKYQQYLPLHPIAIEQFDLSKYDLVISSESGIAKGVILPPEVCHVCYCHSPIRYIWNMYHAYKKDLGFVKRVLWAVVSNYMRVWDYANAQRVDFYIANSGNVKQRVKRYYGQRAEVIHPPVDFNKFKVQQPEDFYLFVGQLNPYKKADLAVKTFRNLGKKLVVIGDGPQRKKLESVGGHYITFMGKQPDHVLVDYYSRCKAFIFPGEEDFGITPLEAMASGKPVIAYKKGGALETVVDSETGIFFKDQTEASLRDAIEKLESKHWDPQKIRNHAKMFDLAIAKEKLKECIMGKYASFHDDLSGITKLKSERPNN